MYLEGYQGRIHDFLLGGAQEEIYKNLQEYTAIMVRMYLECDPTSDDLVMKLDPLMEKGQKRVRISPGRVFWKSEKLLYDRN